VTTKTRVTSLQGALSQTHLRASTQATVDTAFLAPKVNDLLVAQFKMLRKLNNRRAARVPTGILVARTVRVDVDRSRVKD
jgi:hypothetical protein